MTFQNMLEDRKIALNNGWKFCLASQGFGDFKFETASDADFDDHDWKELNLPHDWSIEFDFNIEHSLVGSEAGYLDGGIGWYRKQFVLPQQLAGKCISIHFGGIYMDSTVYVNGRQVGKYPNGYMPFTYDITEDLIADGQTMNTIAVKVVNQQPSSRWYSGSGIYRDVELVITDAVHVVEYGTFIRTPDIEAEYAQGKGTFHIATEVKNDGSTPQEVKVRQTVCDYVTKAPVAEAVETGVQSIGVSKVYKFDQQVEVAEPKLWSVDTPNLYTVYTEVIVGDKVVDVYESRCGFRWMKFDADHGFFLNGEWMKMKGVCMHHDQGALGAVANKRAIQRQMEIMKEMGANGIRVTHNPAADDLLQICDEIGLMVIDEAFDTWYGSKKQYDLGRFFLSPSISHPEGSPVVSWAEFDVKRMVKRGRNFPSIIKWSVGNEVWEASGDKRSMQTIKNFKKWVEEIDPTRGITQGVDKFRFGTGEGDHENIAEYQQTVGFNYAEANYDRIHEKHPEWVIYGSETSSATKSRGVYAHPDKYGNHDSGDHPDYQQSSYDNDHVGWGASATNAWLQDRDREYILGQFIWTGFDYIGEPTPWHNTGGPGHDLSPKSSYFGIVDTAGFPKDDYYLYQSVWKSVDAAPMVHILPHWNWQDDALRANVTGEDNKIPVRVYSNAPQIELFIDGESQGVKAFTQKTTNYGFAYQQQSEDSDRLYLEWRLDYAHKPSTQIKVVAMDMAGNAVATETITTADVASKVALSADRANIDANGTDLCYVTVDLQDANGNFVPTGDNNICFSVEGDAKIVGVDNGNPISHERYQAQHDGSWMRRAFNGKALVIVQAGESTGTFKLNAWGEGIEANTLTVEMNAPAQKGLQTLETLTAAAGDVVDTNEVKTVVKRQYTPLAVEGITVPMVEGMGVTLPEKVLVYYTHGLIEEKAVTWATEWTFVEENDNEKIMSVVGAVDRIEIQATATIRIIKDKEQIKFSNNYAKQWTGSEFPAALASYTNTAGEDKVSYMNDTVIAFEADSNNRWSNISTDKRTEDWVGVLFAEGGNITKRYMDTVRIGFVETEECGVPGDVQVEYYVGNTEPQVPQNFGQVTEGDLADASNWKAVEGLQGIAVTAGEMQLLAFEAIHTYAIRVRFTTPETKSAVAITEIEAYGKAPIAHETCEVTGIWVAGDNVLDQLDDANTHCCKDQDKFAEAIKVTVTNHGKVTIVPATKETLETTIYVLPENGDIGETKVYTILFE